MELTGGQVRAARGFLQWTAVQLAERSQVSLSTVRRVEDAEGVPVITRANMEAIRRALEAGGIEFAPDGGVRLKGAPQ